MTSPSFNKALQHSFLAFPMKWITRFTSSMDGKWFQFASICLLLVPTTALPSASRGSRRGVFLSGSQPSNIPDRSRLLQSFLNAKKEEAIQASPDRIKVPQYMLDLFDAVNDNNGIRRKGVLLAGNIVRSFYNDAPNNDTHVTMEFFFNMADISANETIHKAELRLFKKKFRHRDGKTGKKRDHYYRVDIIDKGTGKTIEAKLVSSRGFGWVTFSLTSEVKRWVTDPRTNKGIRLMIKGEHDGKPHIRFSHKKEANQEPILVVFSDTIEAEKKRGLKNYREKISNDARNPRRVKGDRYEEDEDTIEKDDLYFIDYLYAADVINRKYQNGSASATKSGTKRRFRGTGGLTAHYKPVDTSLTSKEDLKGQARGQRTRPDIKSDVTERQSLARSFLRLIRGFKRYVDEGSSWRRNSVKCQRESLIVDVNKLSYNHRILEPKIFDIYQCKGSCHAYSSQQQGRQTTHATIQAIISLTEVSGQGAVPMPCCAPSKLETMSLLLYDYVEESLVVKLQSMEDMRVTSCGCL